MVVTVQSQYVRNNCAAQALLWLFFAIVPLQQSNSYQLFAASVAENLCSNWRCCSVGQNASCTAGLVAGGTLF